MQIVALVRYAILELVLQAISDSCRSRCRAILLRLYLPRYHPNYLFRHDRIVPHLHCILDLGASLELGQTSGTETVSPPTTTCEMRNTHLFSRIVRIILFPTVFAFFNLYAVWFYKQSWILLPFPELYETFALVAMFYLIVIYVAPQDATREDYFRDLTRLHRYGSKKGTLKHSRGSLRWFHVC